MGIFLYEKFACQFEISHNREIDFTMGIWEGEP
jgi:hypothetical protein